MAPSPGFPWLPVPVMPPSPAPLTVVSPRQIHPRLFRPNSAATTSPCASTFITTRTRKTWSSAVRRGTLRVPQASQILVYLGNDLPRRRLIAYLFADSRQPTADSRHPTTDSPLRVHHHRRPIRQHLGDALHHLSRVVARADDRVRAQLGRVLQHDLERLRPGLLAQLR